MTFFNLARTVNNRSVKQSNSNTETIQAVVKNTYADSNGNIYAADVRVPNGGNDLIQVPNMTSLKLTIGDTVQLNYVNGQRHFRAITGALGAGAIDANNSLVTQNSGTTGPIILPPEISLAGVPFLLQSPSTTVTSGYVEDPGSNIYFLDTAPASGSSGSQSDGTRVISMKRLVVTSLPSTSSLPVGTLLDLVDSYGNSFGMYRLDSVYGWVREDIGISDHKTLVNSSDTTAGFLASKLSAGSNISFTTQNVGGNEVIVISSTASGGSLLFTQTTPVTVNNSVSEVTLCTAGIAGSLAISGNTVSVGQVFNLFARGVYGWSGVGSPNLTLRAYIGSTLFATTGLIPLAGGTTSQGWSLDLKFAIAVTGSSGYVESQGFILLDGKTSSQVSVLENTTQIGPIDWTTSQTINITAQWDTASTSDTITARLIQVTTNLLSSGSTNSSTVPFPVWYSGTAYSVGNVVQGSDGNLYRAVASTTGNDPTTDAGTHWCLHQLISSITLNCGTGARFADTYAASGSPGGAMTPGISSALSFIAQATGAVSPSVATITVQQTSNPTFTASVAGSTTTILSTTNIPIGASLCLKSVGAGGTLTVGTTTTVTGSSYSLGTYTLTVSTMGAASVSGDVWVYAPYYGTNGITVNLPTIGTNVTIQGSTSTPTMSTFFPTLTTSGSGLTGTYDVALSYTWADASGVMRETMPGHVTSLLVSGQGIQVASFTVPTWATGVNVNASNSSGGTLYKQGSMTVVGGVASAYTMSSYSTATPAVTVNPAVSTFPCSMMFGTTNGFSVTNTSGLTINGFYLRGNGNAIGIQLTNSGGNTLGPNMVISNFANGIRVGTQTTPGGPGNVANYVQIDACASIGVLVYASTFILNGANVVRCVQGVYGRYGGWINAELTNVSFNTYGCQASYFSSVIIAPQGATSGGTAQYAYGCTNVANPTINTVGNAQSYVTDTVNL